MSTASPGFQAGRQRGTRSASGWRTASAGQGLRTLRPTERTTEEISTIFNSASRFAARVMAVGILGLLTSSGQVTPHEPSAIDRVGQLLAEAKTSFASVRDYTGTVVRQERIGGQLQPEAFIDVRIRQQPFSVCLKWTAPKQLAGQ